MGSINFGELMESAKDAFKPLPEGEYTVTAHTVEAKTSGTGKPMWKVKFAIDSGQHVGKNIYHNITLTMDNPQALHFFFRDMAHFGIDSQFLASNPSPEQIASKMTGKRVIVDTVHQEWNESIRSNVRSLKAATPGAMSPMGGSSVPSVPTLPKPPAAKSADSGKAEPPKSVF